MILFLLDLVKGSRVRTIENLMCSLPEEGHPGEDMTGNVSAISFLEHDLPD